MNDKKVNFNDFQKIDIRVGRIIKAEKFLKARKPAYKLLIDFGELGIKKSSAQITELYKIEDLLNKEIVAVVNFPPKQIGNFFSEVLVLGVNDKNGKVILLQPEHYAPPGNKIY